MRFEGKSIIITGAASGIGLATAKKFAAEGARLVLGDRNAEGIAAAARDIGGGAIGMTLNVADEASCQAVIDRAVSAHGGIDVLCNIAGVLDFGRMEDLDKTRWDNTIAVNLTGVYLMTRAAMPHLLKVKGNVVNMASAAGLVGVPFNSVYVASKHGVVGLTKALALEYSKQGIRINCICPTGVKTPMISGAPPENIDWELVMRSVPWLDGGENCDPEDIADAVAFLASAEARRITGVAFPVDGGQTAA